MLAPRSQKMPRTKTGVLTLMRQNPKTCIFKLIVHDYKKRGTHRVPHLLYLLLNQNILKINFCKYTRFSSTHFLRFRYFQLIAGILPASDYSGIRVDAPGYIPSASVL